MNFNDIFAGRYRLSRHLGTGGFAEVWKAEDMMAEGAEVAVKIFAPGQGLDENGVKVFRKEFALTLPLNHPHLLKSLHFDVYQGSPYLIMPYCEDGSLMGKIVDEHNFSEKDLAGLLKQMSSGLAYLHRKGVSHQDIKPDNILILEPSHYVLADFGISSKTRRTIAKSMRAEQAQRYSAFTPAYAPPEKYTAKPSPAGDIFSLGVSLYELATLDVPFPDIGMALKEGAAIPDLPPSYSAGFNRVLKACMAHDPAARPNAPILQEWSESFLRSGSWPEAKQGKKPVRVTEKMPDPPEIPGVRKEKKTISQTRKPQKPKRKKINWLPIIGGLLLVIVAVGKVAWDEMEKQEKKRIRGEFATQYTSAMLKTFSLEDSIDAYKSLLKMAAEPPYEGVLFTSRVKEMEVNLAISEETLKKKDEARKKKIAELSKSLLIGDAKVNAGVQQQNPTGTELFDKLQLKTASNCDQLFFDVSKGTLNGFKPGLSQEEVKKNFPCFTKVVTFAEKPLEAEVFFEKHQFEFQNSHQGIQVLRYFKGKMSISLMEKSEQEVIRLIGKDPLRTLGSLKGYQDLVFQMDYGTLIAGFANYRCVRVKVYHKSPALVPAAQTQMF